MSKSTFINDNEKKQTHTQKKLKSFIQLLCSILKDNADISITAETFRKSKYDNPTSTPHLWDLMHLVLNYHEKDLFQGLHLKDASNVGVCNNQNISEAFKVKYVKKSMVELGYLSENFMSLPEDMGQGSRELLLAFGWLMCKIRLIERFVKRKVKMFDDDDASLMEVFGEKNNFDEMSELKKIKSEQHFENKNSNDFKNIKSSELLCKLHKSLHLNNKLKVNINLLINMHHQLEKKKFKIYQATLKTGQKGDGFLSVFDLELLKNREKLSLYSHLINKDNKKLKNLLKWSEGEEIFWRWMESVVEEKIKEEKLKNPKFYQPPQTLNYEADEKKQTIGSTEDNDDDFKSYFKEYASRLQTGMKNALKELDEKISHFRQHIMLYSGNNDKNSIYNVYDYGFDVPDALKKKPSDENHGKLISLLQEVEEKMRRLKGESFEDDAFPLFQSKRFVYFPDYNKNNNKFACENIDNNKEKQNERNVLYRHELLKQLAIVENMMENYLIDAKDNFQDFKNETFSEDHAKSHENVEKFDRVSHYDNMLRNNHEVSQMHKMKEYMTKELQRLRLAVEEASKQERTNH